MERKKFLEFCKNTGIQPLSKRKIKVKNADVCIDTGYWYKSENCTLEGWKAKCDNDLLFIVLIDKRDWCFNIYQVTNYEGITTYSFLGSYFFNKDTNKWELA